MDVLRGRRIKPMTKEIQFAAIFTINHSLFVESTLSELKIRGHDPEGPHDVGGEHGKMSWEVLRGLSLQWRYNDPLAMMIMKQGIELHRLQYHHLVWHDKLDNAVSDDYYVGAVDSVWSRIAYDPSRRYQKLYRNLDSLILSLSANPTPKELLMIEVAKEMKKIKQPYSGMCVQSLNPLKIQNIGISRGIFGDIQDILNERLTCLKNRHGYVLV